MTTSSGLSLDNAGKILCQIMSNDPQKTRASVAEHLASFDARLAGAAADVDLLSDIQSRLSSLLADDGGSEADIRA